MQQRADEQRSTIRKSADAPTSLRTSGLEVLHIPVIPLLFQAPLVLGLQELLDALPLLGEVVLHRDTAELVATPVDPFQDRQLAALSVDAQVINHRRSPLLIQQIHQRKSGHLDHLAHSRIGIGQHKPHALAAVAIHAGLSEGAGAVPLQALKQLGIRLSANASPAEVLLLSQVLLSNTPSVAPNATKQRASIASKAIDSASKA
jgi:hypothetical protein